MILAAARARWRPSARTAVLRLRAGARSRRARDLRRRRSPASRVGVMTVIVNTAHMLIYGIPFDVRLSAAERVSPIAAFAAPMLARAGARFIDLVACAQQAAVRRSIRSRPMRCAAAGCRSRKACCVAAQTVTLERLRRVGRTGGGLCADRRRRRLQARREPQSAPAGSAHAGRLRRGRGDRGGLRRAADGRLLRLRADHRRSIRSPTSDPSSPRRLRRR